VRLYDRLFNVENPAADERDFRDLLNPGSLKVLNNCFVEPWLKNEKPLAHFQFQRTGYFNIDPDTTADKLIFNRTVSLKDSWAREMKNS
jgi:glutaminyl-tRNA synthetase